MDTLERSNVRAALHAPRWLSAGLLCLGTAACAGVEPREDLAGDVDRLAERLVQSARERADLRQIRVWVAEIHETRPQTTRASVRETPNDMIGLQLEHELVIALATRLNVVESELVEPTLDPVPRTVLGESATTRGATHVLVGDYVRQRDVLQITLRLIDAQSRLIVAAARGAVKLSEVGLSGSDHWARTAVGTPAPAGATPATQVVRANPGAEPREAPSAAPAAAPPVAAQAEPAAPAALAPSPPTSASSGTGATSGTIEDFESWRKRRMAEQGLGESGTVDALDRQARERTTAAGRAGQAAPADPENDEAKFPWRSPWLARLLGIPETTKSEKR